jgi:hypothetical protein
MLVGHTFAWLHECSAAGLAAGAMTCLLSQEVPDAHSLVIPRAVQCACVWAEHYTVDVTLVTLHAC